MQCIFISALQILTDDLEMVDDFGQSLAADTFNDLGVKQSNTPYSNCLVEFLQQIFIHYNVSSIIFLS